MSNERNRKHQRGSIWLRGSSFYIRYYGHDRKQRTEFLCKRDEKHHSKTCKPVRDLASKVMSRINSGALAASESPTVAEFWEGTYLSFAEKNLRPSTVHSYEDLWDRHIKPHFGDDRGKDTPSSRYLEHVFNSEKKPHRLVRAYQLRDRTSSKDGRKSDSAG